MHLIDNCAVEKPWSSFSLFTRVQTRPLLSLADVVCVNFIAALLPYSENDESSRSANALRKDDCILRCFAVAYHAYKRLPACTNELLSDWWTRAVPSDWMCCSVFIPRYCTSHAKAFGNFVAHLPPHELVCMFQSHQYIPETLSTNELQVVEETNALCGCCWRGSKKYLYWGDSRKLISRTTETCLHFPYWGVNPINSRYSLWWQFKVTQISGVLCLFLIHRVCRKCSSERMKTRVERLFFCYDLLGVKRKERRELLMNLSCTSLETVS